MAAFRRRLELFRELSLPMLKTLDNENRLTIVWCFLKLFLAVIVFYFKQVDGDTDTSQVQIEFEKAVVNQVESLKRAGGMIVPEPQHQFLQREAQVPKILALVAKALPA